MTFEVTIRFDGDEEEIDYVLDRLPDYLEELVSGFSKVEHKIKWPTSHEEAHLRFTPESPVTDS